MKKTKYPGVYEDTPTKDGRKYFYRIYKKDIYGKNKQIKSKKFMTAKEAYDERCLKNIQKNNPYKKEFGMVAQNYFKDAYSKRKESTIYSYEYDYNKQIKPYFEKMDINQITGQYILKWHEELLKSDYKISYLQKLHLILSEILNYAIKYYGLEINFAKQVGNFEKTNDMVEEKKKMDYLTYDQYQELLSIVDDKVDFTLYNFLFYTGSRIGEAQALTWEDVNFDNNEIIISKTLTTKTKDCLYKITTPKNGKTRIVIMNEKLKSILQEYYNEMKKYTDFNDKWFVFGCSKYISETTIRRRLQQYFKQLNDVDSSKRISPHGFRHTLVTLLANEYITQSKEKHMKIDTEKFFTMICSRTGHDVETMKKTYMHLFPTVQDELNDLLDNL